MTGSQVVWSQPSPCSSRRAGPEPVFTNALLWPWMVRYWTSIGFGMQLLGGAFGDSSDKRQVKSS